MSHPNRLPADFTDHDLRKLNEKSAAKDCIMQSRGDTFAEEHGHGKARGAAHHPDHCSPYIHPPDNALDHRPASFTGKKKEVQGKVGQDSISSDVYSANQKETLDAQRMRRLQHSLGSGDILAFHEKGYKPSKPK